MHITETPRLYLREFILDDAQALYDLNADPEVLKYTGDTAFESIAAAKQFIKNYDHYKEHGYGRWAVIRKADEAFLGWCGLKYSADTSEHDLGFRFFKRYWNQGYASEAGMACIQLAWSEFNIQTLVGRAMCDNLASIKVLEKLGLQFEKNFIKSNAAWVQYQMNKPQ